MKNITGIVNMLFKIDIIREELKMDVRAYDEMYPVYHERDIHKLTDHMDGLLKEAHPYTRLKVRRLNCGLSQSEPAAASGVVIHQI